MDSGSVGRAFDPPQARHVFPDFPDFSLSTISRTNYRRNRSNLDESGTEVCADILSREFEAGNRPVGIRAKIEESEFASE